MDRIQSLLDVNWLRTLIEAAVFLAAGLISASYSSRVLAQILKRTRKTADPQRIMLLQKGSFYLLAMSFILIALNHAGVDLKVLLGAAGVLTVAIGFASQTSASNLISGLFLVGERPFVVGDIIQVGDTTGIVLSVDLFSCRLRTFDNLLVRIPNENLMKSRITNLTHFPIRRVDLELRVAYKEDIERVKELLNAVSDANSLCLDEPAPLFMVTGFADSSVELQFSVWTLQENFLDVKNSLLTKIKQAFEEESVEIPFPHMAVRFIDPPSGGRPPGSPASPETSAEAQSSRGVLTEPV